MKSHVKCLLMVFLISLPLLADADERTNLPPSFEEIRDKIADILKTGALDDSDYTTRIQARQAILDLLPRLEDKDDGANSLNKCQLLAKVASYVNTEALSAHAKGDLETAGQLEALVRDEIRLPVSEQFLKVMLEWKSLLLVMPDADQWLTSPVVDVIDFNIRSRNGMTPFLIAAQSLDLDMIDLMKRKGGNPTTTDLSGTTVFQLASQRVTRHLNKFQDTFQPHYVQEKGGDPAASLSDDPVTIDTLRKDLEVLKLLHTAHSSSSLITALEAEIARHDFFERRKGGQRSLEELMAEIEPR